jgi:hypothetical protein
LKSTFQRQTRGIATSLNWFGGCRAGDPIKARIQNKDDATTKKWKETTWTRLLFITAYKLNLRFFILGLQQCGGGKADSAVHTTMLDITVSPFKKTWHKVEEEIGIVEVEVGNRIVDHNIGLVIKQTKDKQKRIRINQEHQPPTECVPLADPNLMDLEDKKQVHHLICKACRPIFGDRQEANANNIGIIVQVDCQWDQ